MKERFKIGSREKRKQAMRCKRFAGPKQKGSKKRSDENSRGEIGRQSSCVRAKKFGGAWRFQSKISGETEWTYYDSPALQDLLTLKEIVARKYRRRRASIDDVASVDKLVEEQSGND